MRCVDALWSNHIETSGSEDLNGQLEGGVDGRVLVQRQQQRHDAGLISQSIGRNVDLEIRHLSRSGSQREGVAGTGLRSEGPR